MKEIHVRIVQEEPLLLGNASGTGLYQETTTYVPGGALRGAVAARLLSQCAAPTYLSDHAACPDRVTCPFWRVFGERTGQPLFRNGYPAQAQPAYPFPATARTCKRHPGFPREDDPCREYHGVFDTMIRQFVYELFSDPRFPHRGRLLPDLGESRVALPWRYEPRCPECGTNVVPVDGVYVALPTPGYARRPTLGRATHVGINRERGVAEDALLFTQETVQPREDVVFWAQVVADPAYEDTLLEALEGRHVLGRGGSRGMGAVFVETLPISHQVPIDDRLGLFDAAVRKEVARYATRVEGVTDGVDGVFFGLTLRSEALFTRHELPASRPDPEDLGLPEGTVRLRSWARATVIGGWHGAAKLPYRTQQAVKRGAVYLFHAPVSVDEDRLIQQLEELEQVGVGSRRERGYGQVTACAPFHHELVVHGPGQGV
jgi:CRISPR-associated protein Csx10